MGFFDRIIHGKLYSDKRNPRLACEMLIDGKKILLDEFDMDIDRRTGEQYIPMYAVFSGKPSDELEQWITKGYERKDGRIRFYKNNDLIEESAVCSMEFHDAVCIKFRKTFKGNTPYTTLVMAVKHINLAGEEYLIK